MQVPLERRWKISREYLGSYFRYLLYSLTLNDCPTLFEVDRLDATHDAVHTTIPILKDRRSQVHRKLLVSARGTKSATAPMVRHSFWSALDNPTSCGRARNVGCCENLIRPMRRQKSVCNSRLPDLFRCDSPVNCDLPLVLRCKAESEARRAHGERQDGKYLIGRRVGQSLCQILALTSRPCGASADAGSYLAKDGRLADCRPHPKYILPPV